MLITAVRRKQAARDVRAAAAAAQKAKRPMSKLCEAVVSLLLASPLSLGRRRLQ
jgi:hypothetical protein